MPCDSYSLSYTLYYEINVKVTQDFTFLYEAAEVWYTFFYTHCNMEKLSRATCKLHKISPKYMYGIPIKSVKFKKCYSSSVI